MKNELYDSGNSGDFEEALNRSDHEPFLLKLYVTGSTPQSIRAIQNIKRICDLNLHGRYTLEVINLYEHPELARTEQIIAAPTLVKKLPLPLRRIIGDMSNSERVLVGMGLSHNNQ